MVVEQLESPAEFGETSADQEAGGAGTDDRGVENGGGHDDLRLDGTASDDAQDATDAAVRPRR
jgi:hypothetical protein